MSNETIDDTSHTYDDADQPLPDSLPGGGADPYRPVFDPTVRTIIYVVCLIAHIVSVVCLAYHYDTLGATIATCAGLLAAGFGVAYNPSRKV